MNFAQNSRRSVIGLFMSYVDGTYQMRFTSGLRAFCEKQGCDLVIFAARIWHDQDTSLIDHEMIFRLVSSARLDALCIDTSAFPSPGDIDAYLQSMPDLRRLPVVLSSLGGHNLPSVKPDNRDGMHQILRHLYQKHNCRSFAYIGGPLHVEDAAERKAAFLEFMHDENLTIDPDWVLDGAFDTPSGKVLSKQILEAKEPWPDALVFANDLMALGGLETGARLGIIVPDQLRIVGFDDDYLSAYSSPRLSTVSHSIEQKAWMSGKVLLDALDGKALASLATIDCTYVARESCGCSGLESETATLKGRNLDRLLLDSRKAIEGLAQVTEFLGSVLSFTDLSKQLSRLVPLISAGSVFICLHDEAANAKPSDYNYVVCAIDKNGSILVDEKKPWRYKSENLVPAHLLDQTKQSTMLVQALYKADKHFGFLCIEGTSLDPAVLVALRDQISEVLFNIDHVHDLSVSQTRLELALERAHESEKLFRDLIQSLPVFLMLTGENGIIQYLNDIASNLLGIEKNTELTSINLGDFLDTTFYPQGYMSLLEQVDKSTGLEMFDLRLVSKKKTKLAFCMYHTVLDSLDGQTKMRWIGFEYKPLLAKLSQPSRDLIDTYGLTKRETEVLELELRGYLAKEIADELSITVSTVRGHLGILYRKLGVGTREHLFKFFATKISEQYGIASLVFSLYSGIMRT